MGNVCLQNDWLAKTDVQSVENMQQTQVAEDPHRKIPVVYTMLLFFATVLFSLK